MLPFRHVRPHLIICWFIFNLIFRNRVFLINEYRLYFIGLGKATDLWVVWSNKTFLSLETDICARYQLVLIEVAASFMVISSFFQHPLALLRVFVEELGLRRVLKRSPSPLTLFLCHTYLRFASTTSLSSIFIFICLMFKAKYSKSITSEDPLTLLISQPPSDVFQGQLRPKGSS